MTMCLNIISYEHLGNKLKEINESNADIMAGCKTLAHDTSL